MSGRPGRVRPACAARPSSHRQDVISASHTTLAGHLRHRVELAGDQGAAAVGLDDLDLETVTGGRS